MNAFSSPLGPLHFAPPSEFSAGPSLISIFRGSIPSSSTAKKSKKSSTKHLIIQTDAPSGPPSPSYSASFELDFLPPPPPYSQQLTLAELLATKLTIDDVEQLAQTWDEEIAEEERRKVVAADEAIAKSLRKMGL